MSDGVFSGNIVSQCPNCGRQVTEFFPIPSNLIHHVCPGCNFHFVDYVTRDGEIKGKNYRIRFNIGMQLGLLENTDYKLSSVDLSLKIVHEAKEKKLFSVLWNVVLKLEEPAS